MIHVIATIQLAPGQRDAFLAHFHDVMPHVHREQGCLEYGPTVDVETEIPAQGHTRPDVVVIVEKWEDLESLERHLVAPHMTGYRAKVKGMIVGSQLQVLEPA